MHRAGILIRAFTALHRGLFSVYHKKIYQIGILKNMDLLAADQLHPEPLLHIRATTQKEANKDSSKPTEAIYAVYPSVICSLPGFNLIQTLRNSRKEVENFLTHYPNCY